MKIHKSGVKQIIRISIAMAVIAIVIMIALNMPEHQQKQPPEKQIRSIRDIDEAMQCVNAYFDDDARYVALDYANNDDAESFLNYAIVFQDEDEFDQANILLSTTIGTGSLNFSGDMLTFEYSGEGVTFPETDVFEASFIDREQRDVYDYRVTCVKLSDIDIHFKVESSIRGKTG